MEFKKTNAIILLLFIGLTANLSAQLKTDKNSESGNQDQIGNELPQLKIETSPSNVITNEDVKTKGHLFLITINPTCGHCNHLGDLITQNAELFKQSKVVFMMAPNRAKNLEFFTNNTNIYDQPELIVGVDKNKTIQKHGDTGLMPYINIYKDEKLVEKMNGEVTIEDFKKYLP